MMLMFGIQFLRKSQNPRQAIRPRLRNRRPRKKVLTTNARRQPTMVIIYLNYDLNFNCQNVRYKKCHLLTRKGNKHHKLSENRALKSPNKLLSRRVLRRKNRRSKSRRRLHAWTSTHLLTYRCLTKRRSKA